MRIRFFGFTNGNTLSDIREYSETYPDAFERIKNRIDNERDWLIRAWAKAILFFALENYDFDDDYVSYDVGYNYTQWIVSYTDDNRNRIYARNPSLDELFFDADCLNLSEYDQDHISSNRRGGGYLREDVERTLSDRFSFRRGFANHFARRKLIERGTMTDEFRDVLTRYADLLYTEEQAAEPRIPLEAAADYGLDLIFDDEERGSRMQFVLHGAPGTGKTYSVTELVKAYIKDGSRKGGRYQFVQFHSSYDYTDFVEGLRPVRADGGSENVFVRMDGTFKAFCRDAEHAMISCMEDDDTREEAAAAAPLYFFIIDEINRADLSRVFGELMFSLEESYRGPAHKITTQYSTLPVCDRNGRELAADVFADGFYIPENVVIIGTMNDIDRNVECFDFALRRRFRFIEITAETSLKALGTILGDDLDPTLIARANQLNTYIASPENRLGKEFQLGMAYFTRYQNGQDPNAYFENELRDILLEYCRGRRDAEAFIDKCKEKFTAALRQTMQVTTDV